MTSHHPIKSNKIPVSLWVEEKKRNHKRDIRVADARKPQTGRDRLQGNGEYKEEPTEPLGTHDRMPQRQRQPALPRLQRC